MSDMIGSSPHIRGSEKVWTESQISNTITIAHTATPWVVIRRIQNDRKRRTAPVMVKIDSPRLAYKERSMTCRILSRLSGMLQHFALPDPGRRATSHTSHERNFLCMTSNSLAVLHMARADIIVSMSPIRKRARLPKEKMCIAAIAGAGISGMFHATTWIKKVTIGMRERDFGKQNEWILVIAKLGSTWH